MLRFTSQSIALCRQVICFFSLLKHFRTHDNCHTVRPEAFERFFCCCRSTPFAHIAFLTPQFLSLDSSISSSSSDSNSLRKRPPVRSPPSSPTGGGNRAQSPTTAYVSPYESVEVAIRAAGTSALWPVDLQDQIIKLMHQNVGMLTALSLSHPMTNLFSL